MKNLVMAVAKGYGWFDLEPYVESFNRNCPSADLVLFVDGISDFTLSRLKNGGGAVIQPIPEDLQSGLVINIRWTMYRNFLDAHEEYEQILVTDVRDVIFQSDIFEIYSGRENFLVYAEENYPIRNEPTNSNWIRNFFGEAEYQKIADRTVICCGTVFGSREAMRIFIANMIEQLSRSVTWGDEQAAMNYLVYNELLPIENILPSDLKTGTLLTTVWGSDFSGLIRGDKILRKDGGVPAVVHQYDRQPQMIRLVDEVYREKIFQLDENFTDAHSAFDQTFCLAFRQNWNDATKFFVSHVIYSTDWPSRSDSILKLWRLILERSAPNDFNAEILLAAIQRAVPAAFSTNVDVNQMEKIYAFFLCSMRSQRVVNPSLRIFIANMLIKFADIFYTNGARDWSLKCLERIAETGLPVAQDIYLTQAKIHRELGNKEAALAAYEKALNAS